MNKQEQTRFVTELCNNIRDSIIRDIEKGKTPEDWNGIELRWLVADRASDAATIAKNYPRKREYNNTVIVNNL